MIADGADAQISKVRRLKNLILIAVSAKFDDLDYVEKLKLANEAASIRSDLYEYQQNKLFRPEPPELGTIYFEAKLDSMVDAVLAAIGAVGVDREGKSNKELLQDFEHYSYLVEDLLNT